LADGVAGGRGRVQVQHVREGVPRVLVCFGGVRRVSVIEGVGSAFLE
jgi:uncharacterized protein (DUF697 family)